MCRNLIEDYLIRIFAKDGELENLNKIMETFKSSTVERLKAKLNDPTYMGKLMNEINKKAAQEEINRMINETTESIKDLEGKHL